MEDKIVIMSISKISLPEELGHKIRMMVPVGLRNCVKIEKSANDNDLMDCILDVIEVGEEEFTATEIAKYILEVKGITVSVQRLGKCLGQLGFASKQVKRRGKSFKAYYINKIL